MMRMGIATFGGGMAALVMVSSGADAASCSAVFYNGRPKDSSTAELKVHPALKVCCQATTRSGQAGCVLQSSDCTRLANGKVVSTDAECDKPFPGYKPPGL